MRAVIPAAGFSLIAAGAFILSAVAVLILGARRRGGDRHVAGLTGFPRNVPIPLRWHKPLARFRRTKMAATVLGSVGCLALAALAFAPGTDLVHSDSKIPAAVGHPLAPGRPARKSPPVPPSIFPAQPGAAMVTVQPASTVSGSGASPAPAVAAPAPAPTTPAPAPTTPAPTPVPADTLTSTPTDMPAPTPTDTTPAPADTPTPPPLAP